MRRLGNVVIDVVGLPAASQRFFENYARVLPALSLQGGIPATLRAAPELMKNFDRWLVDINAAVLIPIAAQFLFQFGYGHLKDTSAASGLNYFTANSLVRLCCRHLSRRATLTRHIQRSVARSASLPQPGGGAYTSPYNVSSYAFTDDVGYAELMRRLSATLPAGSVRLSATVSAVLRPSASQTRGKEPVLLTYTQPGRGETTLRCGALLNTVPQTAAGLSYLGLDGVELALFERVRWSRVFTTALVVTPPLPTCGYFFFPLPRDSGAGIRSSLAGHADANSSLPARPLLSALTDPEP